MGSRCTSPASPSPALVATDFRHLLVPRRRNLPAYKEIDIQYSACTRPIVSQPASTAQAIHKRFFYGECTASRAQRKRASRAYVAPRHAGCAMLSPVRKTTSGTTVITANEQKRNRPYGIHSRANAESFGLFSISVPHPRTAFSSTNGITHASASAPDRRQRQNRPAQRQTHRGSMLHRVDP